MDSIYQLKTGEFVDLNRIVKVDNLIEKDNDRYAYSITFQLVSNKEEIIISPSLVMDEIKKAHDEVARYINPNDSPQYRIIDERTIETACTAGKNAYKKFSEGIRNDLVTTWKEFKKGET